MLVISQVLRLEKNGPHSMNQMLLVKSEELILKRKLMNRPCWIMGDGSPGDTSPVSGDSGRVGPLRASRSRYA